MELKTTQWNVDDGVATLTLSRPDSHNAWTGRMHTELRHLLDLGNTDPEVKVIVITGDPDGATFCPGGDATALAGHAERGGYDAGTPPDLANPGYGVRPEYDADFAYFLGLDTVTDSFSEFFEAWWVNEKEIAFQTCLINIYSSGSINFDYRYSSSVINSLELLFASAVHVASDFTILNEIFLVNFLLEFFF